MPDDILFFDVEANGLLREADRIWCMSIGTLGGPIDDYSDYDRSARPLGEGLQRLAGATAICAHNLLGYDWWLLKQLYPNLFTRPVKLIDTLILHRMKDPVDRRHSLRHIGDRLGTLKQEYTGGFDKWNPQMTSYCHDDVAVLIAAWKEVKDYAEAYPQAVELEHKLAEVLYLMERHGFRLDVPAAYSLERALRGEVEAAERRLQSVFPPITHERVSEKTGKRLKPRIEVFNPGSRPQLAARLTAKYKWKPRKLTTTGAPALDEEILASLPYPEAAVALDVLTKQKMLGQLSDGKNGWLKLVDGNGYVHGAINANGARTFRASHFSPNMGQVSKKDPRMRSVWLADPGWVLVGCDADALQLRLLAHFTAPHDPGLIDIVTRGSKDDGTDIHSRNQRSVGLYLRDSAKTLIYALLFGAGANKLGQIAVDDARAANQPLPKGAPSTIGGRMLSALVAGIPGLADLNAKLARMQVSRKGIFKALDGRPVVSPDLRLSLVTIVQCAEAIVMKQAIVLFHEKMWGRVPYHYCAWVHDEIQITCPAEHAETLGKAFAEAITDAGTALGVRCPLEGDYKTGANWHETH